MKKKLPIIIGGVVLALIIVQNIAFRFALNGYVSNDGHSGRLTDEEIETLDEIFRSGEKTDSLTCGFDDRFFVVVNGDVYQPSLDGCGSIYCPTKFAYLNIPDEERATVNEILLNHISELPIN